MGSSDFRQFPHCMEHSSYFRALDLVLRVWSPAIPYGASGCFWESGGVSIGTLIGHYKGNMKGIRSPILPQAPESLLGGSWAFISWLT